MKLSIIIPAYNEGGGVAHTFYARLKSVLKEVKYKFSDYQLIFVDDGSQDSTLSELLDLKKIDKRIEVISNFRNYGVYRSTFAALKYCDGDWVIPMLPIDGQDPPEVVVDLVRAMEEPYLVISGARFERDEGLFLRSVRRIFYRFVSRFSDYEIPPYVGEFQLIHKSILEKLCQINDYYPYTRALIARITSKRKVVSYKWEKRTQGKSKHNLLSLYDQGINGIVSTSTSLLRSLVFFGLAITISCLAVALFQIMGFILNFREAPPGINTLIVGIFSLFGIVFIFLGVIGEYVGAIHAQVRQGLEVHSRKITK